MSVNLGREIRSSGFDKNELTVCPTPLFTEHYQYLEEAINEFNANTVIKMTLSIGGNCDIIVS